MGERLQRDFARLRLYNQGITNPLHGQPAEVVARLVAVQAQDYAGSQWGIGIRLKNATERDVEQEFQDGAILRTHVLRPTWHFVTPADIRWLLALTAPRVHTANSHMYRKLEIDNATVRKSNDALIRALQGERYCTRAELKDALYRAGIAADNTLRVTYLVMHAELDGIVCSGPRRGKQFTYALFDERVPEAKKLDHDEALAKLAMRYFTSRAPATVYDFAKWSGLTVKAAQSGLDAVRTGLGEDVVDGKSYWLSPSAPTRPSPTCAHLLSIYDEYISSYKDRSAMGTAEVGRQLQALGNALTHIMVVNDRIVGSWRRELRNDAVVIETNPMTRLTRKDERAIAHAAHRYGEFVGSTVRLIHA